MTSEQEAKYVLWILAGGGNRCNQPGCNHANRYPHVGGSDFCLCCIKAFWGLRESQVVKGDTDAEYGQQYCWGEPIV